MVAKAWVGGDANWGNPKNWVEVGKELRQVARPCAEGHSHCYHKTGVVMTSDPAQYEKKCCWCGNEIVAMDPPPVAHPGHGPFKAEDRE